MGPQVRVRFAPSPTGFVHVGSLRGALYNYLFARQQGGAFVLRIEDTDRNRYVPGAVENLIETLHWTGLTYDEGPGALRPGPGPHEPYFQSERTALYRAAAETLLAQGDAYLCFCTSERLESMRQHQQKNRLDQKYDRTCLHLTPAEIEARKAAGEPSVVRLRIPDGENVVVQDLVRGRVEFAAQTIDDQVLLKSDGFPTYHLANVVDDHEMEITHVIRGEEWLTSTPKHVLLYRFLGLEPPAFAHLPLLLNPDRSKLSKRQGDVAVEAYREQGFYPEAILNFVAFLGWNPGDERETFSLEELVGEFSLERVGKSGAIFSQEKLRWFQGEYLRRRPLETLVAELKPVLEKQGITGFDEAYLRNVCALLRERILFIHEVPERGSWFFSDPPGYEEATVKKRWTPESGGLMERLLPRLEAAPSFEGPVIEAEVRAFAESEGRKLGDLVHPLRLACTGVGGGPGLFELMEVLGRETCLRRIRKAVAVLG